MKISGIISLFTLLTIVSKAQVSGTVINESGIGMQYVLVVDQQTQQYTYTNEKGLFKINAAEDDTLVFMLAGYKSARKPTVVLNINPTTTLKKLSYSLEEIEVKPELEKYREEHEKMLKTYNKTFTDAKRKPQLYFSNGIVVSGLISGLAARISGQKKKDKRFLEDFNRTESQKLIDLRYNPEVVMSATHTGRDTAVLFIRNNPMNVDFAEHATSLELLMWIRHNYNQWLNNGMDTLQYLEATD